MFIVIFLSLSLFTTTVLMDDYMDKRGELEYYTQQFYDDVGFMPNYNLVRLEYSEYVPGKSFCKEAMDYVWFWEHCFNHNVIGVCSRFMGIAVIELSDRYGALYNRKGKLVLKTEQLLLHELGHLYGLGHSEDEGGPSMSKIMTSSTFPIYTRDQLEMEKKILIRYIQQKHGLITIQ